MTKQDRHQKIVSRIDALSVMPHVKEELIERSLDTVGMYEDLLRGGYPDNLDFPHTTAYINAIKPIDDYGIAIILKWLPNLKYKDAAFDFLRESKSRYDGRVLIDVFANADKDIRWRISDMIATNPPLYINEWIKETYLAPKYGQEAGLLALAVVKLFPEIEARQILKNGFDLHPEVTPEAIGKIGLLDDIPFLEEKMKVVHSATFINEEISIAIKKIMKRNKTESSSG